MTVIKCFTGMLFVSRTCLVGQLSSVRQKMASVSAAFICYSHHMLHMSSVYGQNLLRAISTASLVCSEYEVGVLLIHMRVASDLLSTASLLANLMAHSCSCCCNMLCCAAALHAARTEPGGDQRLLRRARPLTAFFTPKVRIAAVQKLYIPCSSVTLTVAWIEAGMLLAADKQGQHFVWAGWLWRQITLVERFICSHEHSNNRLRHTHTPPMALSAR